MRSTTSSNEVRTILRDNFKQFWTVPAFGLFWLLVWGFVPAILTQSDNSIYEEFSMNMNPGYVIGMLILAVASGMTVFSYLQNPSSANYIHSLPVSRGKLFGANVLSGLLMIAGPILVNGILMSILAGNLLFIKWMAVTLICCFAIFAITVFAALVSGNTLMHLFNTAFFNGLFTVLLLVFIGVCENLLVGFETPDAIMTLILKSNALTAAVGNGVSRVLICGIYIVVGIVALLVGWAVYRRRPIERSGNSVIFTWTRAVLFLVCVFCGSILAGLFSATIMSQNTRIGFDHFMVIGIIIGALIVFVIGSLMIDRSAKIFTRRNMLPAAVALVLAFAVSASVSADVLGYSSNVPDAKDVKAVYVDTQGSFLFNSYDEDGSGFPFRGASIYYQKMEPTAMISDYTVPGLVSEESIYAVTKLQRNLIDQDAKDKSYADSVRIIYELKNGKTIRREYDVYMKTEGEFAAADIDPAIREAAGALYDSKEFKQVYSLNNLRPEYFEKGTVTYQPDPYGEEDDGYYAIPKQYVKGLKEAMEKDFQECGYEQSMRCKGIVSVSRNGVSREDDNYYDEVIEIPIPKTAKHTNAWLKEHKNLLK